MIAVPTDAAYGDHLYENSGQMTAIAIQQAILPHSKQADIAPESSATRWQDQHLAGKCRYYIEPTILHWENRATEWSGKSDRITIRIEVFDVQSRDKLAAALIEGKSKWATFGGDQPQDLLLDPLRQYFEQLYGAKSDNADVE